MAGRQKAVWTKKVLSLLDSMDWVDYEKVVTEAADSVPDAMALERAEFYRAYYHRRKGQPVPERAGTPDRALHTGQRIVLTKTIQSLARQGYLEIGYPVASANVLRRHPAQVRRLK